MKNNKTIQELKDTRVKTTFKVEITVDLPYFDKTDYLEVRLIDLLEEMMKKINQGCTDGHVSTEDNYNLGHKMEMFYGVEEEEEYNIHDWDI